jgi:CheY-like chemotaxis protein
VIRDTRVLVVDDNATNRRILEEMLRNWGMRPTAVSGVRDALQSLRQAFQAGEAYTLVVTDANMPEFDGFYLAEQIKQDRQLGSTVIMMLTSGDRSEDIFRCEQLGVAAYLLKPIKQSELFDAIVMALGVTVPEDEVSEARSTQRPPQLRPLRILLAEDSLVNQKLAVGLLEKHGHTVVVASHGKEALAASESHDFDLVLMDVQMPEMDGFEATSAIRAKEKQTGIHVPIVAMTAHAMKGDRERCLEAGMDDYVAKPIRSQQLFETIEAVLGRSAETEPHADPTPADGGIVDWSEALKVVKGDRALLKDLVETFLQEAPRLMEAMRQAIADSDSGALRIAAHTLKGPIRYLGAAEAFEQAWELERMGKDGNLENAEAGLAALQGEMARLISILEDHSPEEQT